MEKKLENAKREVTIEETRKRLKEILNRKKKTTFKNTDDMLVEVDRDDYI